MPMPEVPLKARQQKGTKYRGKKRVIREMVERMQEARP